jgi:putative NADH-flavin reductase
MANDTTISSHSQVVLNNAMKKHNVRRLIVVTSYGCLGLRNYLISTRKLFSRVFMTGILKDKVLQEDIIQRESEHFDWTIVRPITLKDGGDLTGRYWVSSEALPNNKTNKVKVLSRKDLAHYLLTIINQKHQYKAISWETKTDDETTFLSLLKTPERTGSTAELQSEQEISSMFLRIL